MIKRFIILISVISLLFSFVSCVNADKKTQSNSIPQITSESDVQTTEDLIQTDDVTKEESENSTTTENQSDSSNSASDTIENTQTTETVITTGTIETTQATETKAPTNTTTESTEENTDANTTDSTVVDESTSPDISDVPEDTTQTTTPDETTTVPHETTGPAPDETVGTTETDTDIEIPSETETDSKVEEKPDVYENGMWIGKEGEYLSSQNYYQYSLLSDDEKVLYNKIVAAIKDKRNVIDVGEIEISSEDIFTLVCKVRADNPQFFWVSGSTSTTCNPDNDNVASITLRYTDGIITDVLDDEQNLTTKANRDLIDSKIDRFNTKIKEIVSLIPHDASDFQKEKIIHDYIVSNTIYDHAALNYSDATALPHAYDSYGAIIEGKAVCEGYSEAFQYLCYCVGINATQITGTANGGNHMWNAVKIDGEWYQIDVTWDDPDDADHIRYSYFNLSGSEMYENHTPNTDRISIPVCNGEKYQYTDYYALIVSSDGKTSTNYQSIAERLIEENSDCLIVSIKDITVTNDFMQNLTRYIIHNRNSVLNNCAKELGVTFNFEYRCTISGNFIYVPLTITKN